MLLKTFIFIICGSWLIRCPDAASIIEDLYVTEAPECSDGEFRCKNGACVTGLSQCNGTAECPDGSDETFGLCRNTQCDEGQFRCAYGACVTGGACDGVQHCADNSDEQLTRCLPESNRTICDTTITRDGAVFNCHIQTDCENGQWLAEKDKCDGKVDCADGTDETIARCAEVSCNNDTFRCAYGGCAPMNAKCNGVIDCADGSDESDDLCDRSRPFKRFEREVTTLGPLYNSCILPPFPENGAYLRYDGPSMAPGNRLDAILLNYTCNSKYQLVGKQMVYCLNGKWSDEFPTCKLFCKLPRDEAIDYRCLLSGGPSVEGDRPCNYKEPSGTRVQPECRGPNYHYPGKMSIMQCEDGEWDYVPMCIPECGRVTPKGTGLVAGGRPAKWYELPWHAAIYRKRKETYEQICGGSIISTKVIISAAHCFWNVTLQPASNYAVAVGMLNRAWEDPDSDDIQHRDVFDIKIPVRYRGVETNFQDDIALVVLKTGLQYSVLVRPVCLDFGYDFDVQQLQAGNKGKVAGWGFTTENGDPSPILKVAELPYVPIEQCLEETPFAFKVYITSDKICAGYRNGTAVCRGDSGGGLSFPKVDGDVTRYYLRGLVSTAPGNGNICNTLTITSFTHLLKHQQFIESHFETFSETGFRYFDVRKLSNYNKY